MRDQVVQPVHFVDDHRIAFHRMIAECFRLRDLVLQLAGEEEAQRVLVVADGLLSAGKRCHQAGAEEALGVDHMVVALLADRADQLEQRARLAFAFVPDVELP